MTKNNSCQKQFSFSGWQLLEISHNTQLPCSKCGITAMTMYYKVDNGELYPTTKISCHGCLGSFEG